MVINGSSSSSSSSVAIIHLWQSIKNSIWHMHFCKISIQHIFVFVVFSS